MTSHNGKQRCYVYQIEPPSTQRELARGPALGNVLLTKGAEALELPSSQTLYDMFQASAKAHATEKCIGHREGGTYTYLSFQVLPVWLGRTLLL